ncbi:MAG: pitrilysin family protein [Hydrogenovibrio sp.]|uniref:M16 family metallopeptidase n=1 Tax=Hydrogenovibrio sp. TaxID=2065821 RepID=UPI0028703BA3|nr:pitrilysin family protein [Hydrogenovibrio sp.]MDR9499410.1 pitrilysin family protein [Hydrogenovibrio sp.]
MMVRTRRNFNQAWWFWGWLVMMLGLSGPVQAEISTYELDNGMQVVVKPDHRSPVAVQQVWYKVGSNFEHSGRTGLSHMLEHMMFKGTESLAPGEFSDIVSKLGGQENAFTSRDYTAYYQVVGAEHLPTVMKHEADRMRNIEITDEHFQTERDVVAEERRWRTEDRPSSKLYELFRATAFINSPQHHPVIGWMSDIQNWTLEDVQAWYQRWYAPNNATLVVVGDVDPEQVYQWAKTHYGAHEPEAIAPPKPQTEMPQQGERRMTLKAATHTPELLMGFHVPSLVTAKDASEVYALAVLNHILDGDDSARLTTELVNQSKLNSASSWYDSTSRWESLLTLNATPKQGQSLEAVEALLWEQLERLKASPISQDELDRVLAQAEAQHIYHQDSIQAQARLLGMLASLELPLDTYDNWASNLRKVTPEQVQAVARKYLKADKATYAHLYPNGETVQKTAPPAGGMH